MNATSIPQSFSVVFAGTLPDGEKYLELDCRDFDAFKALPAGLMYDGGVYGCTGWNSDRNRAYYKASKKFAMKP